MLPAKQRLLEPWMSIQVAAGPPAARRLLAQSRSPAIQPINSCSCIPQALARSFLLHHQRASPTQLCRSATNGSSGNSSSSSSSSSRTIPVEGTPGNNGGLATEDDGNNGGGDGSNGSGGNGGSGGSGDGGGGFGGFSKSDVRDAVLLAVALLVGLPTAWSVVTQKGTPNDQQAQLQQKSDSQQKAVPAGAPSSPSSGIDGNIMALKRLVRELFAEQLGVKGRLGALEEASARQLEPGDAYEASLAAGGWDAGRPPRCGGACGGLPARGEVRWSGAARGGAALLWSQGRGGAEAAEEAARQETAGHAGVAVWLHTVLGETPDDTHVVQQQQQQQAHQPQEQSQQQQEQQWQQQLQESEGPEQGGQASGPRRRRSWRVKQRLTAKLVQQAGSEGARLTKLLYRSEIGQHARILVAPLGGRLSDAAAGPNPHAPLHYGMTPAFRAGHGLGGPGEPGGCGAAAAWDGGAVSAAAGHFCRSDATERLRHSSAAQVSLRAEGGASLSLLAGRAWCSGGPAAARGTAGGAAAPRFEGGRVPLEPPGPTGDDRGLIGSGGTSSAAGVVAALPIADALVASAWVEGRSEGLGAAGRAGLVWGFGVHSRPDERGGAVGLVLVRLPQAAAAEAGEAPPGPLLCELSCRLPIADGLELSPGALVVRTGTAADCGTATVLRLAASWRF